MEGHPEGCEEHGKFFFVVDLLLVDAQIVYWDLITNALYRLLLVMSVKNQVGSHFPLNLSCIQSQFIHRGIMWGFDFVGPITPASSSGNRFILTLSDYYTKWVDAVPLPSKHATGVAASLLKVS